MSEPRVPRSRVAEHPEHLGLRERKKLEKLERITEAAADLFRQQGFEATTGRQICERAGIGTGTLFLYVNDKRDLLALMFRPQARAVFDRLARGLNEGESLEEGLFRIFSAFLSLYARDTALARLFTQDLLFRGHDNPELKALHDELRDRVTESVRDAQNRRELRTDISADQLALSFLAHYVFWLQLWLGTDQISRREASRGLRSALRTQIDGAANNEKGNP